MAAPQSTEDIFAGMLETLAEPTRWTKRAGARDTEGQPVPSSSHHAVCWCLLGARQRELSKIEDLALLERLDEETDELLHQASGGASPSAINDDPATTHTDIVALVQRAHQAARKA